MIRKNNIEASAVASHRNGSDRIRRKFRYVDRAFILTMLTVFQLVSFIPVIFSDGTVHFKIILQLLFYISFEWFYVGIMRIFIKKVNFELEFIAFFLSGIGLCLTASVNKESMFKQLLTVLAGIIVYDVLLWYLQDIKRVMFIRTPLALFALCFLAGAFLYIRMFVGQVNGSYNWLYISGISLQPSEFVKIAFVFVGAASLDKLLSSRSIYLFIIFAMGCIGVLFLMKDFGTALIFFFTFIVISFMRSGDLRTIVFICAIALLGALLIIYFRPHVAARFASYRHIWEDIYGRGYQQTRVLIYSVSGGLFGVGIGNGCLRNVYASTTDLVFGMICEELGIFIGVIIVVAFASIAIYAMISSRSAPSTFYSISACSAAAMILFQTCLNIFGITDLLPLTGVTLPFISQGGSSMICTWALFAFIKAADVRAYPKIYKTN